MDINKLTRLFNTLKYLKAEQFYYRIYYLIKNKYFQKSYESVPNYVNHELVLENSIANQHSYSDKHTFTFLNQTKEFGNEIDWNYSEYGKLWTYNLTYFDFLNQPQIDQDQGKILIEDFIEKMPSIKDGLDAYPISLRGINWIKFLVKYQIRSNEIDTSLFSQYARLNNNLEYHILGNHLLENAFSLLFGAYYFKDASLYKKAEKLLKEQLKEQILSDGAHFELSPMYHQIILHRLLDCINLVRSNPWKNSTLLEFLEEKAAYMLGWLKAITFQDGSVPMVNDAAFNIAPNSRDLFLYANELKISAKHLNLGASGYRKFQGDTYELFIDVGKVGPQYQPGHAHSDTFSFVMQYREKPLFVDLGTSTYQKDNQRQQERKTSAHNTVEINGQDQSQVWGGFRVGERAKIVHLEENLESISAIHDGYKKSGILHERSFVTKENIVIFDKITSKSSKEVHAIAFYHLHPRIQKVQLIEQEVYLEEEGLTLKFEGDFHSIRFEHYKFAYGFNKTKVGIKIIVPFSKQLKTIIKL